MPSREKFFPATQMPDRDWWQELWPNPDLTLRQLGLSSGMVTADLCCGDGYFTWPLAEITGNTVYAVELDPGQLSIAQANPRPDCDIVWLVGDARDIDTLVPNPLDAVLIANTFHGVPDKPALCQAISRTLSADGVLIIVNWHAQPREQTTVLGKPRGPATETRLSEEALTALLEPIGFELQRPISLPPYHYGAVFSWPG